MESTDASGVSTSTCLYCNGIWVTEKALLILVKLEKSSVSIREIITTSNAPQSLNRQCPQCLHQPLNTLFTHGIEIDACEKCAGIFFDENEIQNVLPKTHQPQNNHFGKNLATESIIWMIVAILAGS